MDFYWLRIGEFPALIALVVLCLPWWAGGLLLARHAFNLRPEERLLTGLALGLLLFITLSNLFANSITTPQAFWLASTAILLAGLVSAKHGRRSGNSWVAREDFKAWPQILLLALVTSLFALIGRGLGLFDDYLHIPLVSVMGAGDIPPHFYLNPPTHYAYHYGLQVFAASLIRVGGFFPWSAWDFSKALAIGLTLLLGGLWVWRVTRSQTAAFLGGFLFIFAGGARWLLLLLPRNALKYLSERVPLSNTGLEAAPNLVMALSSPWPADGSGPVPFPFAFHNGLFTPVISVLGSTGAMSFFTVFLLLLLSSRVQQRLLASIVIGLIYASLALSAEHLFVMLWIGTALAAVIYVLRHPRTRKAAAAGVFPFLGTVLALSSLLSLVQGAYITEAARSLLLLLRGLQSTTGGTYQVFSFSPRWPPAFDTAHFGALSFFEPADWIVLLAELGPALFLAPLMIVLTRHSARRNDWILTGFLFASFLNLIFPAFSLFGVERSTTRFPASAMFLWVVLAFPALWRLFQKSGVLTRFGLSAGYSIMIFGALVIFAVQMVGIPFPQYTYFVEKEDAWFTQMYWDKLPERAEVLDRVSQRGVALFGRPSRASYDYYHALPKWEALVADPMPEKVFLAGYSYLYMDQNWWALLNTQQQAALRSGCVRKIAERSETAGRFRWLLDLTACNGVP